MRLSAPALLLGLAMFAGNIATASAEASGPDYLRVRGVASGQVLNIRAEPSAKSAILGTIPANGDGIRNKGCRGGLSLLEWEKATPAERKAGEKRRWCEIDYRGVHGFVAGRFVGEGSAP